MARKRRYIQPGFCYHVMIRGCNGQNIFIDDADRSRFCLLVQYASEKHQLKIHAFCLMDNHVHFVIQPLASDLSAGIHAFSFRYVQHFNKKYRRCGYLFQGRYKAILVQSGSYFQRLVRYVHLNPIRAAIVQNPEDYQWSSYRAYIGIADYTWLDQALVLDTFSSGSVEGLVNLTTFTRMNDEEAHREAFEIRQSVRKGAYGNNEFLEKWCPIINEEKFRVNLLECRTNEVTIERLIEVVCCHFGTDLKDVRSDKRTKELVQARTVMALLTQKLSAGLMATLGRHLSRDSTSLGKLARKNKDNPQVQTLINELFKELIIFVDQRNSVSSKQCLERHDPLNLE